MHSLKQYVVAFILLLQTCLAIALPQAIDDSTLSNPVISTHWTTISTTRALLTITSTYNNCTVQTLGLRAQVDSCRKHRTTASSTFMILPTTTTTTHDTCKDTSTAVLEKWTTTSMPSVVTSTNVITSYTIISKTVTTCPPDTSTTTNPKCFPSAIVSAAGPPNSNITYGISNVEDTPDGGATYRTTTLSAGQCCELCIKQNGCAGSAWNIMTLECRLDFVVDYQSGGLSCQIAGIAYYKYGPNNPMEPGTGWYLADGCGRYQYVEDRPDR